VRLIIQQIPFTETRSEIAKDSKDVKDVKLDVGVKEFKASRDTKSATTPKEIPKKRIFIPDPASSFDLSSIMDMVITVTSSKRFLVAMMVNKIDIFCSMKLSEGRADGRECVFGISSGVDKSTFDN